MGISNGRRVLRALRVPAGDLRAAINMPLAAALRLADIATAHHAHGFFARRRAQP